MRDVKTRAAMEQPKTRQKNAIPRTAVRILQRHYAQQKQEWQTQHQRQKHRQQEKDSVHMAHLLTEWTR